MNTRRSLLITLCALLGGGCAAPDLSRSSDAMVASQGHWFSEVLRAPLSAVSYYNPALPYNVFETANSAAAAGTSPTADAVPPAAQPPARPPLSPGDRIRLFMPMDPLFGGVFADQKDPFSGIYEVGIDGQIQFPYLPLMPAAGLDLAELQQQLNQRLEAARIFQPGMARASLVHLQWAAVSVHVAGAVFEPGLHTINQRPADERRADQTQTSGDRSLDRLLPTALRAAGGVRPDADLTQIQLIRGNTTYQIDLTDLVLGNYSRPVSLMEGDQLRIPSVGTPQRELVRPSAITPPGIRVFISNLTTPSLSNANSAVGKHASNLPYGARLVNAVVSGNCAGGSASTNSGRYAVLVTQHPATQQPITVERAIEDLLRAPERLDLNPYLMPNDSIVCYDSDVSDLRNIGRTISDILLPLTLLF